MWWRCCGRLPLHRGDQRELHDSGKAIDTQTLAELGVIYREIPIDEAGTWENTISQLERPLRAWLRADGTQMPLRKRGATRTWVANSQHHDYPFCRPRSRSSSQNSLE